MKKNAIGIAVALATVAALAACSTPGQSSPTAKDQTTTEITSPITPDQVKAAGTTTLKVWADAGEEATLKDYIPKFEKQYPTVKVDLTLKGFDDLIKTVVNALDSEDAPDVAQGNQGFAVDGMLVKAKLIRPLDDAAKVYGWDKFSPAAIGPFRWNDQGSVFGEGPLYGMSPVIQNVGIFYNADNLAKAGLKPATSFDEWAQQLPALKAAGVQPLMLGNSDQYPGSQVFSVLAATLAGAQPMMDWIGGKPGATIDTPEFQKAAQTLADWAKQGYLGEGFNGVSADDAAARFAAGEGAYYVAGDWNLPVVRDGGIKAGFMAPPAGPNGKSASAGSLGMGWHVSAKSKNVEAAVAFIAGLHSPEYAPSLVEQGRVPIADPSIKAGKDALLGDDITMSFKLLDDDGVVGFLDWATDTMYDESGARTQELLDGRLSAKDFTAALQADWAKAH